MSKLKHLHPAYWSVLILLLSQAVVFLVVPEVQTYLEETQIIVPEVSPVIPIVYFFVAVIVLGIVLFLIPVSRLKLAFKVLFSLLFVWGVFVNLTFYLPAVASAVIAFALTAVWFVKPRLWYHDLLLMFSLAALGVVFGSMLSPLTSLILMGVLSLYDILAVRFGYMMWIAKKLSHLDTLPAFIIPKDSSGWNTDLKKVKLLDEESSDRHFSLLGGGDIGFPLILMAAVHGVFGLPEALIIAACTLAGLLSVYAIQRLFFKGKAVAALPPITLACLAGYLIITLALP